MRRINSDNLLGGFIRYIKTLKGVKQVEFQKNTPTTSKEIQLFQRGNLFSLPIDLIDFLKQYNGFDLKWFNQFTKHDPYNQQLIEIGSIKFNRFSDIIKHDGKFSANCLPKFGVVYFLEEYEFGRICLCIIKGTFKPEIWLYSSTDSHWYFITHSFTCYFRLLVANLGIKGWQLAYTCTGIPSFTFNWMCYYCPAMIKVLNQDTIQKEMLEMVEPLERTIEDLENDTDDDLLEMETFPVFKTPQLTVPETSSGQVSIPFDVDQVVRAIQDLLKPSDETLTSALVGNQPLSSSNPSTISSGPNIRKKMVRKY
ncbi:hypothetical protein BC833DRAFT_658118 [Globomyces pollinis-pini]|nr:hypothetical protein BC833DRAFT_658118 [Globomyces pollinis-pini]